MKRFFSFLIIIYHARTFGFSCGWKSGNRSQSVDNDVAGSTQKCLSFLAEAIAWGDAGWSIVFRCGRI